MSSKYNTIWTKKATAEWFSYRNYKKVFDMLRRNFSNARAQTQCKIIDYFMYIAVT